MKVGEYARTKRGIIGKIKLIDNQTELEDLYLVKRKWYYKEDFIKSSPNIIDLIEECDLIKYRINGDLYVSEVEGVPIFDKYKLSISYADTIKFLEELDIVSVVTREQFESMEYIIGE